jgi:two-component system sensor histidine kinase and response regulator WspE
MSGGGGLGGFSLLELFKLEAEAHCAALSDGLLALEKSPGDRSVVEPLMRAAHSIKGAARIVGLDVIVTLAHAMEECFLAAKDGREALTSTRVDQLLKGVDVLSEIRGLAEADLPAWTKAQADRIAELIAQLKAPPPAAAAAAAAPAEAAKSTPAPAAAPAAPATSAQAPEATAAPAAASAASAAAATVRVAAGVMNRMMFLAGESTVEASRLQSLRQLLTGIKARQRAMETSLQSLRESIRADRRPQLSDGAPPAPVSADKVSATDTFLTAAAEAANDAQCELAEQSVRFDEAFRRVEEISGALYTEVLRSRLRPFSEGVTAYPRMVRDISRQLGKSVELKIEGASVEVDRDILQKLESPLTHMIRNALDHGIETATERQGARKPASATITVAARHQSGMLVIEVRDDGRGIDPEAVRRKVAERKLVDEVTTAKLSRAELMEFLFLPGFSTKQGVTELSGRGVGLDVVRSMVAEVGGTVRLESEPGRGARFTMRLPVTRSVIRAAMVRVGGGGGGGGELFAMPLARLDRIVLVPEAEVAAVQGRLQFTLEDLSIGLVHAAEVLTGAGARGANGTLLHVALIGSGEDLCGLIVDEVCGEEDLVVRPLDPRLGTVRHIAAAAIRSDGEPVLVVDVDDLWRSVKESLQGGRLTGATSLHAEQVRKARQRILVVDDSITVREVERQLLLRSGYDVDVAVDGKDGYNMLRAGRYDLMVTDVDMPRMTGIELIRAVRKEPKYAELPIVIVSYKDREEDRLAGLDAGASAYLTKSSFQDDSLIRMIRDLIGAPG